MGGKYGVAEATKIVVAAATIGNTVDAAVPILLSKSWLAKLQLATLFLSAAPAVMALSSLDLNEFKNEVAELDDADTQALVKAFEQNFKLNEPGLQLSIDHVVEAVAHASVLVQELVKAVIDIISQFKSKMKVA